MWKIFRYFLPLFIVQGAMAAALVPKLIIQETDGSPSGQPAQLKVSDGSLTDNGDGSFSLTTGGSGVSPGSTNYIQNTLSPTISTQVFFVQGGTVTTLEATAINMRKANSNSFKMSYFGVGCTNLTDGALTLGDLAGAGCSGSMTLYSNLTPAQSLLLSPDNGITFSSSAEGIQFGDGSFQTTAWNTGVYKTTGTYTAKQSFTSPEKSTFTALNISSVTITSSTANNSNIIYGITVGTFTGAGISSCGDSTHALSYGSGLFGCQALSGGGGSSSGTIIQIIQSSTTSTASTTNTSYANTNLSATITPVSASSYIKIMAVGTLSNANATATAFATISKGATNILPTSGLCSDIGLTGGLSCTMVFIDTGPFVLSATTYFVQIKTDNGAFATSWGIANQLETMILEEVNPSGGTTGAINASASGTPLAYYAGVGTALSPALATTVLASGITFSTAIAVSSNTILPGATFYQSGNIVMGTPGQVVQISSNTILPGATFYQNGYVNMGLPGTTISISSNTILPGATFYQSGNIVLGTAGQVVQISSNVVMPGATFYQNGSITLGQIAQSVTISSNVVMPGATFYQAGPVIFSTGIFVGTGVIISTEITAGITSTALTIDWSKGNTHTSTATNNVTFTFVAPTVQPGAVAYLHLGVFTGAGSFTATWPATVKWPGGVSPVLTTTATKMDWFDCRYRQATGAYYCDFDQNYTP